MSQPRVTFAVTPVVQVVVKGEGEPGPVILRDGGLVARFISFLNEAKIFPAVRGGSTGGGVYIGFFAPEDASRIEAWLIEQGVERE